MSAAPRRTRRTEGSRRAKPQQVSLGSVLLALLILAAVWGYERWQAGQGGSRTPTPVVSYPAGGGTLGLFVEPDDGRKPVLAEIEGAKRSIDLEVYLLSDEEIIKALEAAQARGIQVRVLLEQKPYGGGGTNKTVFTRLQTDGIAIRWTNPAFTFTHAKYFVIDNAVALVMNLNVTKSAFTGNREFGVVTTRPAEVAQAAAIFQADWDRTAEPPPGPLVVSPTDARSRILALIGSAKTSIDVYAEVVRDRQIIDALKAAKKRGVAVRLVVSGSSSESDDRGNAEQAELAKAGVDVRLARGGLYIHAKMILVDGTRAYIGSQNFTATSLDQNRELGIILDDPAAIARIRAAFEKDYQQGKLPPA